MEQIQYVLTEAETCSSSIPVGLQAQMGIGPKRVCDGNPSKCDRAVPFQAELLQWLGGWELPSLPPSPPIPELPPIVVSIKGDEPCPFERGVLGTAVAARVDEVVGLGSKQVSSLAAWRERRGISREALLILHQESRDDRQVAVIMNVLLNRSRSRNLLDLGNLVVIAPMPSIYTTGNQCRQRQLTNLRVGPQIYSILAQLEIPVILSVGWATRIDLSRIASMLREAGDGVTHLAVNVQSTGRTDRANLREMAELEKAVGRSYHWVLIGSVSQGFLNEAEKVFPSDRRTHVSAQLRERSLAGLDLHGEPIVGSPTERLRQNISIVQERLLLARRQLALRNPEAAGG